MEETEKKKMEDDERRFMMFDGNGQVICEGPERTVIKKPFPEVTYENLITFWCPDREEFRNYVEGLKQFRTKAQNPFECLTPEIDDITFMEVLVDDDAKTFEII